MDIALKQRLVGASVLVALGVILIPMLLEGPRDVREATTIPIPEPPDSRFETRLLPLEPPVPAATEAAPPQTSPREVVAVETGAGTARGPAEASTLSPSPAAAADPAGRRWILQLGSFGNAANAARLVEALIAAGWKAYQEKVQVADDTLYRVRAGDWGSKAEAAAAGTRIAAQFEDLDISVRALDDGGGAVAPELNGWLVQVGSFTQRDNAYELRDRLRSSGFPTHVQLIDAASGGGFRVRVGPELDRAAAQRLRDRLRAEFDLNGIIVEHP